MLKNRLIATMEKAENPLLIRATAWALERVTGVRTADLLKKSAQEYNFNTGTYGQNWYAENGYDRLAVSYGGYRSHSGKAVAVDSALEFGAVYACVKIISQDIGSCPFFLHERDEIGEHVTKAYGHPTFRVLHDQPNADMSSGEFREALTAQALLGIDGFADVVRDSVSQDCIGMWPYAVGEARVDRDSKGRKVFLVKRGSSPEQTKSAYDIFHLKGFSLDGQKGDDILRRARHAIGLGLSADEYAASFFSRDSTPGVVMSVPPGIKYSKDKVDEIKAAWVSTHRGGTRTHNMTVTQDGVTLSRIDPDFKKLQLLESRENQIVEVAMMYQMPLHKLAQLKRATNNNIEHQGREYEQQTLRSWFRRWQDAAERCLLSTEDRYWPSGRPRRFVEFNVESLVRGDSATQWAGWKEGLLNGVYCPDDILGFLNMDPLPDGRGKIHRVQMQMQDVAQAAQDAMARATQGAAA